MIILLKDLPQTQRHRGIEAQKKEEKSYKIFSDITTG